MDYDLLFGFLHENIKNNRLKYESEILKFCDNFEIKTRDIKKTKVMLKSVIIKIAIGTNINLLLEDLPSNFFLSFGIVVGDKSVIKSFKLKDDEKLYVAEKKVMNKLIEHVELDSVKDFSAKKLKSLRYHISYSLPTINLNLKEFSKKVKKIDLDVIHIVNSDSISNFVPTVNTHHLSIASRLGLEVISLIDNSYIIDSNINIFDENGQIELLNPKFVFENEQVIEVNKINGKRVYRDFSKQIYVYPNSFVLIEKLNNAKFLGQEKETLVFELSKIKKIKISSNNGRILIPLWTAGNKEEFISIKNKKEFLEITGIDFDKQKFLDLKELFIQSQQGLKGKFCMNYLRSSFENVFEKELLSYRAAELQSHKDSERIEFGSLNELLLKLMMTNKEELVIVKSEFVSKEKIKEIDSSIRKLLPKVILKSVEFNKLPLENLLRDSFGKYYVSVSSQFYRLLEDYSELSSKNMLASETLRYSRNLLLVVKTKEMKFDYLYDINNCILALIAVLKEFDLEKSDFYQKLFNDYFENQKPKNYLAKNILFEKFVNDVTFVNIMSKKYRVCVLVKKEFDLDVFNENVVVFNEKPTVEERTIRPNYVVLKKIFPYSFDEVALQLKKIPFNIIKYSSLNLKGKIFPIKEDYYDIFEEYFEYKLLFSNEYFLLLGKKEKE